MEHTLQDLLRRCSVEFIGTFFLVFFVGLSNTVGVLGPLVPGLTLMICVFAGGHISLGSFNPAVSLALTLRPGLLSWKALLFYVLAEMLGGVFGALMAWAFGGQTIPADTSRASLAVIFFAEFFASFALVTQVLNSGTSADYEGNSFFGLAIGGTLTVCALVFGPISGAVLNPAVGLLALFAPVYSRPIPSCAWVYFVAPPLAAVAGAVAFRFVSPKDHAPREALMHGPVDHPEHHRHGKELRAQYAAVETSSGGSSNEAAPRSF